MKHVLAVSLLIFALVLPCAAQTNLFAGGVSYNNGASPAIAGTGLYARLVSDAGTYAFTAVDALPASVKPFTVTTQVSAGIAQRVLTINNVGIYVPTSAGISYNGTNTGWAWTTGALASVPIAGPWRVMPNVRLVKSSVSGGAGYQIIAGVMFGWGS